jgi:hypothetical protein
MPKRPTGKKRPDDVVGNAVRVLQIATGEREEEYKTPPDDSKGQAAVALGKKVGAARGAKLTKEQRAEIARKAAASHWKK